MIGIAMTTYNGERFLREQIDSILNQTYADFELIVCDDGSSDSTVDILNEYAQKDSRVHIFQNEKNLGVIKNFEKAIRICLKRGAEYIALSDQDDIWIDTYLEILINIHINNPDIFISYGSRYPFSDVIPNTQYTSENLDFHFSNIQRLDIALIRAGIFIGATMLIKKTFFDLALPINEEFGMHDIWFVTLSEALNKTKGTNRIITFYRRHNQNVTNGKSLKEKLFLLLKKKPLMNKYFLASAVLERVPNTLLNPNIIKELHVIKRYYKYKRFFLFRLTHFPFFIKRYKVFTYRINPVYACLKFLFWG